MDVALGVLLGLALAASLAAGWRLVRAPRVQDPSSSAMQAAVHAATSLLPHLRRGLGAGSAPPAAPQLRVLTGASAVALADSEQLLAFDGAGGGRARRMVAVRRALDAVRRSVRPLSDSAQALAPAREPSRATDRRRSDGPASCRGEAG